MAAGESRAVALRGSRERERLRVTGIANDSAIGAQRGTVALAKPIPILHTN
jgi:hypothetical protein